jgi:hypothetical protein
LGSWVICDFSILQAYLAVGLCRGLYMLIEFIYLPLYSTNKSISPLSEKPCLLNILFLH